MNRLKLNHVISPVAIEGEGLTPFPIDRLAVRKTAAAAVAKERLTFIRRSEKAGAAAAINNFEHAVTAAAVTARRLRNYG